MDEEIELAPASLDRLEGGVEGRAIGDVAGQDEIGAKIFRQRFDPALQRLALIGEGQFGPLRTAGLGNALGDGPVVRHAHDQAPFSVHQSASHRVFPSPFVLSRFWHRGMEGASSGFRMGMRRNKLAGMTTSVPDIAPPLAAIVGAKNVLTDASGLAPYLQEPRKRFHTTARAVVRPGSVREVQSRSGLRQ